MIDLEEMDRRYLRFRVPSVYLAGGPDGVDEMVVVVKLDDEGVVLDLTTDGVEVLESTWKTYDEFGIKTIKFEE